MFTKTFRADSALETLQMVQADLGANAIVVSMREIPLGPSWNPWKKSSVEIVATTPESAPPQAAPVLRPSQNQAGVEFVEKVPEIEWDIPADQKLAELRTQTHSKLKLNLTASTPLQTQPVAAPQKVETVAPTEDQYVPPTLKKICQQLSGQGVDASLVDGVVNVALETLSPVTLADHETCKKAITQLLGAELRVKQGAGTYVSGNVVCLIGASGSGKTSTIAKLSLFYSQKLHKTITWVCADTVRSGAVAEARAYTDAMGINLKLVYTPEDLKELLDSAKPDDLFLVDTPGYNPCNENQMVELGELLMEIPKRQAYLVASATTKETDLFQIFASLGIFKLDGLIITKLDETHSFGSVYNFARRNQLSLAYFATGTESDRHLEVADPGRLVSALFGKEWNK